MKVVKKLFLDFIWWLFPEKLGIALKFASGGWVLGKIYDPETNEVIAYRLICYKNDEVRSIVLWGDY